MDAHALLRSEALFQLRALGNCDVRRERQMTPLCVGKRFLTLERRHKRQRWSKNGIREASKVRSRDIDTTLKARVLSTPPRGKHLTLRGEAQLTLNAS